MDNILKKHIGTKLTTLLAVKDKKQIQLAEALKVTPNTVSYWCAGTRAPNIEQIIKIAEFFNVSTDYLLTDTTVMTKDKSIQAICDYTGLSQNAVEILAGLKNSKFFSSFEQSEYSNFINYYIETQYKSDVFTMNSIRDNTALLSRLLDAFILDPENADEDEIDELKTVINGEKYSVINEHMRMIDNFSATKSKKTYDQIQEDYKEKVRTAVELCNAVLEYEEMEGENNG